MALLDFSGMVVAGGEFFLETPEAITPYGVALER